MTEAERTLLWHGPEEVPTEGATIVAIDPECGDSYVSYGGGRIDHGWWAYAEDFFCKEMMMLVHERENEIASWLEQERDERTSVFGGEF